MATYEVDPVSRIEGHLGVKLTETAGVVTGADVHGNLWRGFENFLVGREVNDAITFTQRICGVCPVPHGLTATFAADNVLGYNQGFQTWARAADGGKWAGDNGITAAAATPAGYGIPAKALHVRNLVLSAEFLMSSMTHSFHLAAPSYVQGPNMAPWTPYFNDDFYHEALRSAGHGTDGAVGTGVLPVLEDGFSKDLWSAVIKQYVKALRIRRLTFEAGALFAGRMPMTSCFVAGGVTTDKTENLATKSAKYRSIMQEIGQFIIREYVPLFLALGALYPGYDNVNNDVLAGGDGSPSKCKGYGGGCGNYLAWGGFPQMDGTLAFGRGTRSLAGVYGAIDSDGVANNLKEHIGYSRYAGSVTALNADGTPVVNAAVTATNPATELRTVPKRNVAAKYSWLKAPRWNNVAMEVGPMARMFVMGVFQNNVELAASASTAVLGTLIPSGKGYDYYVKAVARNGAPLTKVTGLDPKMIGADLAVALVREGLANLVIVDTTTVAPGPYSDTLVNAAYLLGVGVDEAAIAAAYNNANAVITGAVTDWVIGLKAGKSTMDRLRGRAIESFYLIQKMVGSFAKPANATADLTWLGGGWLADLAALPIGADSYVSKQEPPGIVPGFGATEAPRGALMHMCTIDKGKISRYQCIVPTTWNASPKGTGAADLGPMESAMIGIPFATGALATKDFDGGGGTALTAQGGVEALRVAQSFDPCIACAVH